MPCMVSIICTVYNHEKYLRQTLEGFVTQETSFEYELLIHDDASTDNSAAIIKEYERKYPHIVKPIYQTVNQYSQGRRISKLLISQAQGKYIAFCEGDDYWTDSKKLDKQITILEAHPEYSGSTHNQTVVMEDGTPWGDRYQMLYRADTDEVRGTEYLVAECKFGHTASTIMRKDILVGMDAEVADEFYQLKAHGDLSWNALMAAHGKVYHIAEDMACYRYVPKGGTSWSARTSGQNIMYSTFVQLKDLREFIAKYYGVKITYQAYIDGLCFTAYIKYLKKPTKANRDIICSLADEAGYGLKEFMYAFAQKCKRKILRTFTKVFNKGAE